MINEAFNKKHKDFITSHEHNPKAIISKMADLINSKDFKDSHLISRDSKAFLLELTRQTIYREFNEDNYILIIDSIFKDYPVFINSTLIEVIWLIGLILEKRNESSPEKEDHDLTQIFSAIVNTLMKRKIVMQSSLMEKLEESSLYDCGLIQDKKVFKTRFTRINTKITYEQQKYNLLREESEGFAKLLFLLFQVKITKDNVKNYIDKILSLIGFFDLDPNRVLDIILSAFEKDALNKNFLEIIKLFNRNAVPHMLGFKFTSKKDEDVGLFIITAQLIKYGMIDIAEVIPYISPTLKDIESSYKAQIESAAEYYKNLQSRVGKELNLVSTSTASATLSSNNQNAENPLQNANYFVNFPELVSETYKNNENGNQVYRLLEGLIIVRDYQHCEVLYSLMESFYDPLACPSLIKAICETVFWMIDPLYKNYSLKKLFKNNRRNDNNSNNSDYDMKNEIDNTEDNFSKECSARQFNQIITAEDFLPEFGKIGKYLSLALSTDLILFTKILTILKENTKLYFTEEGSNNSTTESQKILTDLICKVFLPSLSLIDPPPSLVTDLWTILCNFDYSKRYKIYNYWTNNIYSLHPALYIKYGVVLKETAKWHKTLSKENQRSHGRTLGILTNSNPIIVFDNVIRLLTSYDNQINVFMQTLSFCSSLSYDVITYIISKILADPNKEKFNVINGDMASWFKYFAYFIGHFFKKFHFAEFSGILYYLGSRLKNTNNFIEMYVLKEVVEKMTGIVIMEEMNEGQIYACAGGIHLYLEAFDLVKEYKNLKKPTQALLKFFMQNSTNGENSEIETEVSNANKANNANNANNSNNSNNANNANNVNNADTNEENAMLIDKEENYIVNINGIMPHNNTNSSDNSLLSFTSVLLILLGTRRQNIIFNSNYSQSKLIGYLYDQIQNVYLQLVQFLSIHTDRDIFAKLLPKWRLERFVINYNCQPEVIFFLNRNKLKPLYEMPPDEYSDMMNQHMGVLNTFQSLNKKVFREGFDSLYIETAPFLDDIYKEIWNYVTPELYFIFSALQLKDIYVPVGNYEREIEKNKKELERVNEDSKKEIEKIKNRILNLERELSVLKVNNERIIEFLEDKKMSLLEDKVIAKSNRREISRYLIQFCLYPRLIFSKVEAVYAAKMLVLLIDLKIQNINVFDIMQKIVKFLLPCILCLTEFEAQNLGVFLLELLKVIKYWQDEQVWEKCRNAIIVLNYINSVYPPTKEIANELTTSIEKALEKFVNYEDLTMMMKRYRDILTQKSNLPFENEIIGESKDKMAEIKEKKAEIKEKIGEVKEKGEKGERDKVEKVEREKEKGEREKEKGEKGEREKDKEKDKDNLALKNVADKKKKKDRSREKKRDEGLRMPEIKKRSPEEYRNYKPRK